MKAIWDSTLDAETGEALIDVRIWMSQISLDSIGIAGFGHDLYAIDGKGSAVVEVFESFGSGDPSFFLSRFVFLMGPVLPIPQNLPSKQNKILKRLRMTTREIADELLSRNRREKEGKTFTEHRINKLIVGNVSGRDFGTATPEARSSKFILVKNVLLLAG